MKKLNWELIQSFYIVSEQGSLSKAALILNSSQPTVSRQIALLEKILDVTLFNRSSKGLIITEAGTKFIESCAVMNDASEQFYRIAAGETLALSGSIRLTANEVIGTYYLPDLLVKFSVLYPNISVEVVISNNVTSLHKRDADIALRMIRPSQQNLIAKRLKDIKLNFVASEKYLSLHSEPENLIDAAKHSLIGFDKDPVFIKNITELKWPLTEKNFNFKTDFFPLQIELVKSGAGISILHEHLIKQWPELKVILKDVNIPVMNFWLVCHADVQHNRKIRVMMDFLSEHLETTLT
jgi:DNA-binding transcriptional LysR family regulator